MNTPDQIKMLLSMLVMQVPTVMVCLVAVIVILSRAPRASGVARWALLGFGLVFMLCIAIPVAQILLQRWVTQGEHYAQRGWAFPVLGMVSSGLHALAYTCLLVAIVTGRAPAPPPPQWPPNSP